jgi:DNA primase
MKGRYVFPIFDDRDDLIGFSGRLINPSDTLPKWKHVGQKKNFIFPFRATEHIQKTKTVMIVESIGDCLKLMECGVNNVLVSFGVSLSPRIIQHLLRLDVNRIVISLNNDEDNGLVGNLAAQEYKEELMNFFDEHQLAIALPTAKDFGEMSCEAILEWKNQYLNLT